MPSSGAVGSGSFHRKSFRPANATQAIIIIDIQDIFTHCCLQGVTTVLNVDVADHFFVVAHLFKRPMNGNVLVASGLSGFQ